jgi:hypothetical protein
VIRVRFPLGPLLSHQSRFQIQEPGLAATGGDIKREQDDSSSEVPFPQLPRLEACHASQRKRGVPGHGSGCALPHHSASRTDEEVPQRRQGRHAGCFAGGQSQLSGERSVAAHRADAQARDDQGQG